MHLTTETAPLFDFKAISSPLTLIACSTLIAIMYGLNSASFFAVNSKVKIVPSVVLFLRLFKYARYINSSLSKALGKVASSLSNTFPFFADVNVNAEWSYPTLNLSPQIPGLFFISTVIENLSPFSTVSEDTEIVLSLVSVCANVGTLT